MGRSIKKPPEQGGFQTVLYQTILLGLLLLFLLVDEDDHEHMIREPEDGCDGNGCEAGL